MVNHVKENLNLGGLGVDQHPQPTELARALGNATKDFNLVSVHLYGIDFT